jgi:hypothetical protein
MPVSFDVEEIEPKSNLGNYEDDMQVGRGHLKLMSAKHLKALIKKIPNKGDYRLAGKKKNELVDYCCQRCGIK